MEGGGIIFMKIVDYEKGNLKYTEMLALYTFEDILKYAKENNNFVGDDFSVCVQLWLQNKISGDFYNVCSHVSKSSLPTIAAFTALSKPTNE